MSMTPGTRFGHYEVAALIGVGGMGEVYRATDTNLKRDVALKVLPESLVADPNRLARLQREAEVLASLNHTNVAHIYGIERYDGNTAIVMELIDGATLDERLAQGPLPPSEALNVWLQIVAGLEAAHERGIVHRDLKPANVKIKADGTVKVLDFGIAKALDARAISGSRPPPLTTPAMTEAGLVLGTAAYMAPEQARGKAVDKRADIWAFGCVLYEMLTGKAAFLGEDVTSTLARVLERDPDLKALPASVSPPVRRTLELCLQKDVKKRLRDIGDVRLALAGTFATDAPAPHARSRLVWPVAAAVVALFAGTAVSLLKPASAPEPKIVARFDYVLPAGVSLRNPGTSVLDIAPDGEFFAFEGSDGIYVRRLGDVDAHVVPGTTAGAADVAISPDGRELAYFRAAPAQLVKVATGGGAPVVLAEPIQLPFGLSWEPNGTLYYGQPDGIWRVSHNGGTPEHVVKTEGVQQVYGPQLLPGGEWLLFTLAITTGANRWNDADIVIQSLKSGERHVLRSGGFDARYLPSGHLTYAFQNALFASAFNAKSLELDDERVALVQGVQTAAADPLGGSAFYAVSNNGTLVFVPGLAAPTPARPQRSLAWVDRQGNAKPLPLRPDDYTMARISPDGTRIALVVGRTLLARDLPPDIYIYDLESENLTQLTFNSEADDGPVWSRDGSRIFYRAFKDGIGAVTAIRSDGGTPELFARSESNYPLPWSTSSDGETLLLNDPRSRTDFNFATVDIGKDHTVKPLLDLAELLSEPSLSPNGQWLLYGQFGKSDSDNQINIRPFPDVRQQRRPVGPGASPVFSPDGSEIFFSDGAGLSVVPVQYSPFRIGGARKLFRGQYLYESAGRSGDVDPKNDRFLMITKPNVDSAQVAPAQPEINVVLNWLEELKQRVPTK